MNTLPSYSGRTFWEELIVRGTEELTGRRWYQWRYVLAIREYEKQLARDPHNTPPFFDFALRRLDISYQSHFKAGAHIPEDGPLLVVSNHPTGFTDGIILTSLIHQYRHDMKFLANGFLTQFEYMKPWLLALPDPNFAKEGDTQLQTTSLRAAYSHIKQGQSLGVFPATRLWDRQADGTFADPPWREEIAKFAQIKTKDGQGVRVLPIYVDIENTPLFKLASKMGWYTMRRGLLIHEMVMQQHQTVNLHIGKVIEPEEISAYKDKKALIDFLRTKSDELKPE